MLISKRKDYFWNTLAGIINASEAVAMSMVVTRLGKLSDAGVLSLAFAIGNILMTIGKFGGRMYQVTDSKKQYSFRMYLIHRTLTIILMMVVLDAIIMFGDYSWEKQKSIILVTLIYAVESVEDCFWGYFQSIDRLYVGAQLFAFRWLTIIAVFCFEMLSTHNMVKALLISSLSGVVVFGVGVLILKIGFRNTPLKATEKHHIEFGPRITMLFLQTFPLFLASFCSIFISAIPKLAIDRYLNDEVQACYGFVAMPVFVIGLFNQFIYQPTVLRLTIEYNEGEMAEFRSDVRKQVGMVICISIICVIGASVFGIPILSFIFNTDLHDYWIELVVLQLAGTFLALSGYFTILLTIMRKQIIILTGYVIVLLVGIVLLNLAVACYGTIGASVGYFVIVFLLFLYYIASYYKIILNKV